MEDPVRNIVEKKQKQTMVVNQEEEAKLIREMLMLVDALREQVHLIDLFY